MALVMGIAGLDTYVHRMIVWRIDPRYELPKALRKLGVQFGDFADMSDEWLASQQAGSQSRPWVRAKNLLHERLLRETFQSYEDVQDGLAMAGVKTLWSDTAEVLSSKPADIKTRLNGLVHRRNQVVHEGDIRRQIRPQGLRYNAIVRAEVLDDLDWLEELIGALNEVVSDQE